VNREADDLSAIVRDSALMPEPGGSNVRTAVGAYVSAVVDSEWPAMHDGNTSALALTGLDGIFTAFGTVKPKTATQVAFYNDAVRQLNDALTARRDRIQTAGGGLPRDITILILFSSFVIVAYAVLVGSPNYWFHVLGPAAIAMVVAVSLVVLVDLTYPFSGDVSISSDPYKTGSLSAYFYRP
jgi:hypothetical protein